ncbi:unnamed protein product [Albugo candida]|uniref:SMP-30/Gluconolactonase/LRE-like region domain-containing protein n=1 Tax=Albugo candida TaxID=65357 RepID=A0A024G1F2_9STRA|nr:unnamed protein product [Albugo candida]|eukprot:CCI40366.1 unnamed protein product [Albugo candida]
MHSLTKLLQLFAFFSHVLFLRGSDAPAPNTPAKDDAMRVFQLYCKMHNISCTNTNLAIFKRDVYPNMLKKGKTLLKNSGPRSPSNLKRGSSTKLSGSGTSEGNDASENDLPDGKLSNQKSGRSSGKASEGKVMENEKINSLSGDKNDPESTTLVVGASGAGATSSTLTTVGKGASAVLAGEAGKGVGGPGGTDSEEGGTSSSVRGSNGKAAQGSVGGSTLPSLGPGSLVVTSGKTGAPEGETKAFTGGRSGSTIASLSPAVGAEASGGASMTAIGRSASGGTSRSSMETRGASGNPSTFSSSVTFLTQINAPSLASNVALLQDNTLNMQTIVHSSRDSSRSLMQRSKLSGPAIVTGLDPPQGRRSLAADDQDSTTILFCDVPGNALWRWKRANSPKSIAKSNFNDSKIDSSNDICSDATISLDVVAYQAGCSLQNHPQGCHDVEHAGCGGITVNPLTNRATIARTGGGTLGTLQFKKIGDVCQGQIVDVISSYRGQPLKNPSSVEYTSKGTLYFTDSDEPPGDTRRSESTSNNGVYVLGNGPSASVELLDCGMARPNKIAFSPDEKHMYVTNSEQQNAYIKVFDLGPDGSIESSKMLFNISAHPQVSTGKGFAEGIKLDANGNIYVVCYQSILIIAPSGTLLGTLTSDQELYDLTIGHNAIYVTGEFGISVYDTIVDPAIPIRQTVIDCEAF